MKDADFARLADTRHPQGILAVVKQKHYELKDLTGGSLYIILETIQDPGNLGTIIRTAEAAGVSAVIMNKGCVDIYSPKVVRSTMGSIFRVPFIYSDDLTGTIRQLKEDGIVIYAADLSGTDMYETAFSERKAYVIGNEANGVSSDMISLADRIVKIPMEGQVDSLNAAVSAAVLMYRR
ncbi:MAG: RNA methyltransferase [Lachnospiraceae bacterium]|nr:RNA methyltransferase [Lachnospiraceae bacterium]